MTKFCGDAVGVRSGRPKSTLSKKDLQKNMEKFLETGVCVAHNSSCFGLCLINTPVLIHALLAQVHPELERARQERDNTEQPLPAHDPTRPFVFLDLSIANKPAGGERGGVQQAPAAAVCSAVPAALLGSAVFDYTLYGQQLHLRPPPVDFNPSLLPTPHPTPVPPPTHTAVPDDILHATSSACSAHFALPPPHPPPPAPATPQHPTSCHSPRNLAHPHPTPVPTPLPNCPSPPHPLSGRLVVELYQDIAPAAALHLRARCLPGSAATLVGGTFTKLLRHYAAWGCRRWGRVGVVMVR